MPKLIELNMVVGRSVDDLENASEQTTKVWLNPEEIREFYARREGATGTRTCVFGSYGEYY